ncbi:unnamed protein product [Candidula unifasciata]|uniref:Omega-crystallin n=1 Tax=Candidula unifasciata TaxID=100452 RepID=A0A8S3ZQF7_9EUPU|nr:unnamed protein product [Candidula unifasciata]
MEEFKPIRNPEIKYTQLFINNEFVNSVSGNPSPTLNPRYGEKLLRADVDLAVQAAQAAFALGSPYRQLDASARGRLLSKIADLLERDVNYIASLETLDNGKTFAPHGSIGDVLFSASVFRYYAGWTDKICGRTIPVDGSYFSYTRHEPVGVCGQIIPWNYPIVMATWKIAPAVAAGNVVILKPAEQTPLTALYLASLIREDIVHLCSGYVRLVTFTGYCALMFRLCQAGNFYRILCTYVGKLILQASGASNIKRTTLELGGKSPCVIFDDVDVDSVAAEAQEICMTNMGQCCVAGTRTFVHENIYDAFVAKTRELAQNRKIGDPFDSDTVNGPQIDQEQFNKILGLIESGKKEGAKVEVGGERHGEQGFFIKPTVFSHVTDDMRIARKKISVLQIFGPVQQILKFKDLDEVLRRANDTQYGLGAYVYTNDINRALTFAHGVQAGTVWINSVNHVAPQAPFGGFKMSGLGRELGEYGLQNYLEVKNVVVKLDRKY